MIVPSADDALGRRAAQAVLRSVDDAMQGFAIVVGRSRIAVDPMDLHRAAAEALLAANVAVARRPGSRFARCCHSRTPAPTGCCCPR